MYKIHGTALGYLFVGASLQHLFFKKEGDDRDKQVLSSHYEKKGFYCPGCRAVLIENAE